MTYLKYFLSLLILVSLSCSKKTGSNQDFTFHPNVNVISDELKFNDLIEDYKFIKLETNENCLIGEVKQLQFYKSKIYILTDVVNCFNMEGKFLFAINQKGRGPDEFTQIHNFSIDEDKIFLNTPRKIMSFDSNTGMALKSYSTDYYIKYLCCDGNKIYIDLLANPKNYPESDGRVFISDLKNQKSIKAFLPEIKNSHIGDHPFIGYNKQLYYIDPLLIQVFKIYNNQVEKYISFDFGNDSPTKSDIESLMARKPWTSLGYNKAFQLEDVYETPDFIRARVILKPKMLTILFDKKSNKSIAWDAVKCGRGELYQYFADNIMAVYEDYFCTSISASFINHCKARMKETNLSLSPAHSEYRNYDMIMRTEIMDNPVIAMYKFRKPEMISKRD
jgi:hypothetical protein